MKDQYLAPGIHGPSLRWYKPTGAAALVLRSAWRFWVTGKPLRGRGDNATFLHDATVDYRGGPVERLTRARWRRVAWRWGVAGVPWLLADAWLILGRVWLWVLLAYLVTGGTTGGWLAWRTLAAWWPQRAVRAEFVVPVWQVVCRVLGERYNRRAAVRSVVLSPGFGAEPQADEDAPEISARLYLPAVPLDDGMKRRIAVSAGERLGMPDPSASWVTKGARAYVDLAPKQFPPRKLAYAEVRELVLSASAVKPFVGLAAGRVPVHADLDNDGPHIGVSGGTGTGKSSLLRIILARRVREGAGLVVCDYKVTSHLWARRIAKVDPSRVLYVTDEEEISDAIMAVFAEFCRRREILKEDPDALESFRDVDLLVEELNTLASMLRKWWGHERKRIMQEAKDADEPAPFLPTVPEAVDAMAAIVQMGRQLRMRVHFAAQRLDASILSPKDGGAVRESITNRFLAKYTKQAWAMLCGGVPFEAFPGGPRGIWTAVIDGVVTHFRVPLMTDDDAYDLAMSGVVPAGPVLGGRAVVPAAREVARLVTLGEAWELVGAPSLDALRKAVQRAELEARGRRGNALTYDVRQLEALYRAVAS